MGPMLQTRSEVPPRGRDDVKELVASLDPTFVHTSSQMPRSPGKLPASHTKTEPQAPTAAKAAAVELPPEPTRADYDTAIRNCAHRGDVDGAEALVRRMLDEGHEPCLTTCNFLLNACAQSGDMIRAQQYLQKMLSMNIVPDQVSYNLVINGWAMQGDVAAVENWLRHMISCNVKPNNVTFGTVCKAFARMGEVEKVERVMQALTASGEKLNEYFYAALISACAEAKQPQRAERALLDLVHQGLRPSTVRSALGRAVGRRRANMLIARYEPPETAKAPSDARGPDSKAEGVQHEQNRSGQAYSTCSSSGDAHPSALGFSLGSSAASSQGSRAARIMTPPEAPPFMPAKLLRKP